MSVLDVIDILTLQQRRQLTAGERVALRCPPWCTSQHGAPYAAEGDLDDLEQQSHGCDVGDLASIGCDVVDGAPGPVDVYICVGMEYLSGLTPEVARVVAQELLAAADAADLAERENGR